MYKTTEELLVSYKPMTLFNLVKLTQKDRTRISKSKKCLPLNGNKLLLPSHENKGPRQPDKALPD